jgi:hypothetical protein
MLKAVAASRGLIEMSDHRVPGGGFAMLTSQSETRSSAKKISVVTDVRRRA